MSEEDATALMAPLDGETDSEDPFRDIESLREEDSSRRSLSTHDVDADTEVEDEEEAELTSFSTDGPSVVEVGAQWREAHGGMEEDSESEDERDQDDTDTTGPSESTAILSDNSDEDRGDDDEHAPSVVLPNIPTFLRQQRLTPIPPTRSSANPPPTPIIRSAMKSSSITPVSVMKDPNRGRSKRPRTKQVIDGRRRVPVEAGSGRRPSEVVLQPLRPRRPTRTLGAGSSDREASRRVFSRLHLQGSSRDVSRNATFLTECSFGVAHDRLVQVITDVQPFEPYWEELTSIDLSNRHIDSAARLKEFLPRLDSLSLNFNQLSWLSGIPGTVRTLSVASNTITGLTSFSHLLNLENLDISRNQVDSLRQLECLRHLRELRADGNRIDSVDGLQKMDGLVKLSLQGNIIYDVDLRGYRWTRLEMLNLSHNRLSSIEGLGSLPSLIALNLDHNLLERSSPMQRPPWPVNTDPRCSRCEASLPFW
ncbi:Septation initiation network scaffold protein cdc11 [Grifola frondosa]|uniref:Septation initiation network scaffold protein cdc11 n=1 Tax=Grifola frondosa TaxID=5627 RepID=A0A1C7M4G6_GRIFR|nr:Septation initiation network scaffold protein cdc11 [Grifola frondosa]